ncbi:unnamed protein product [Darwinula stevensoni]|uniref:Fibronectin type-III domain-containing protein n=1 Tax=Darwinula stevensoni TaxID=69355 RepID=A0A7R9A8Z4_9CRUS|nr:unnamed protein product [Darwinula stevensoni]CAG0896933.1 unnamed protein product [Darwinula stevensoni]
MNCWAFLLFLIPGIVTVKAKAINHRSWGSGELARMQPQGGILGDYGQYIFESEQDIKLLCTLTDAGLNEGIKTSDLRFKTPSGDVVKPNLISNNATVLLIIVNATAPASGRYYCGNVSDNEKFSMLHTVPLEIGFPPLELKSWRCWSKQLERLYCHWSKPENPVWTDYFFFIQTDGMTMTECRKRTRNEEECEAWKGQTPPYRPGETETNITVKAQNVLGHRVFTYPFDHYRNIKIEKLENVEVKAADAETLDITWDLPGNLQYYNVSIVHNIRWVPRPWAEKPHFQAETSFTIPGDSYQKSWNYALTGLIPNTIYDVEIKAIVLDAEFSDLWSDTSGAYEKTMPKAPDRSPEVPPGSFHVDRIGGSLRNISLYWIPLEDWEQNSDNLTYRVEGLELTTMTKVEPTFVTERSAVFKNLRNKSAYRFHIVSRNDVGESPQMSIIEVDTEKNRIPHPKILKEKYDDGKYKLEWKASEKDKTTNFTVFWCLSPPSWPTCASDINWVVVPKSIVAFELESIESLKFAVSANGELGSSGLSWKKAEILGDGDARSTQIEVDLSPSAFESRRHVKSHLLHLETPLTAFS